MTRGTTRQILADLQQVRSHVSAVHVTRSPTENGLVQITVAQTPEARDGAKKLLVIFLTIFGSLALISAVLEIFIGVLIFGWLLLVCGIVTFTSYDRAARAYVLRAGRDRIVVASSGPLGPRYWECPREGIGDVRLVSRQSTLGRQLGEEFRPQWIQFSAAKGWVRDRTFALDLSRDEFILLSDAVREGLGMAKTTWS